jgi:hypothetical protein
VYEYAQHMRALCGPLLRREAFIAGLTMLRNVIARRRSGANDKTNNDETAWPVVLWKQVSVQHFNTTSGNFDILGGGTDQLRSLSGCVPLRNITLNYERNRVAETVLLHRHRHRNRHQKKNHNNDTDHHHDDHDDDDDDDTDDDAADLSSSPTSIRIIPTYELEMSAYDQHVSLQDCTHYCNPSPTMLDGVDAIMTQLLTATVSAAVVRPTQP